MSAEFNIYCELLITLVGERPVLWDNSSEEYKDRRLTLQAWKDVCPHLKEDFETLGDKERNDIGKLVIKKWANIMDNWMKCHKKLNEEQKSGSGAKRRKYLFYKELRFLTKIATHRQTTSNMPDNVNLADRQTERQEEKREGRTEPVETERLVVDKGMAFLMEQEILMRGAVWHVTMDFGVKEHAQAISDLIKGFGDLTFTVGRDPAQRQ
ncbi:hypothetical protein B7P43_G04197 [Cryptotermes secundus]|uniref:MADF domain-containing protein n=1 Tax=Cryptotermes secundus TaxID=105785 RepID=A0A2J7PY27_9NEOP|nr:hypothetical protein B7P43_G04197 [Cryptotermes secundus]